MMEALLDYCKRVHWWGLFIEFTLYGLVGHWVVDRMQDDLREQFDCLTLSVANEGNSEFGQLTCNVHFQFSTDWVNKFL